MRSRGSHYNARVRRLLLLALIVLPRQAHASIGDGVADEVFGQPNMTTGTLPSKTDALTLLPVSIAIGGFGGPVLYVAEPARHRVITTSSGIPSSLLGQDAYTDDLPNRGRATPGIDTLRGPQGVTYDASLARYAIADTENNRVLVGAGKTISGLYGQPSFDNDTAGVSAFTLRRPHGVALAGVRVYVADTDNHRVVLFNAGSGSAAAACYGQFDCTKGFENGFALSSRSFKSPRAVSVDPLDAKHFYVADTGNHRVIERIEDAALAAYGQLGSFTSAVPSLGGVGQGSLNTPVAVAADRDGFWVVDQGHYRVLHFRRGSTIADRVLGQKDFWTATRSAAPTASTFMLPTGVAVASNGDVYVADGGAARVLRFKFTCSAGACNDNNACTTDTCTDAAGCSISAASELAAGCAPYRCDVINRACLTSCAARPCVQGFTCTVNKRCVRACSATLPCPSGGTCIDGTCCDTPCNGKCEKCDLPGSEGICSSYSGKPKQPCAIRGDCGGQCNGFNRLECEPLPAGFACGAESCRDGIERRRGSCDGAGTCTSTEHPCAPFTCGSGACLARCLYDFDCADGARCESSVCATIRVSGQGCAHAGAVESSFAVWVMSVAVALIRRQKHHSRKRKRPGIRSIPGR